MKRNLLLLVALILCSAKALPFPQAKSLSVDEVVLKAQEQKKKQKEYLKDYVYKSSEALRELDSKGKVKSETKVEKKIYVKGDLYHEEILSVEEDGKFSNEKEIKKWQEQRNKMERESVKEDPSFSPLDIQAHSQSPYYFLREDTLNGVLTYLLKTGLKAKEILFDEWLWVDQKNFGVIKEERILSKKQKYLKEMRMEVEFQKIETKDPSLVPIFLPASLRISAEAGFLFKKKRLNIEKVNSDFQLNPGLGDEIFPVKK